MSIYAFSEHSQPPSAKRDYSASFSKNVESPSKRLKPINRQSNHSLSTTTPGSLKSDASSHETVDEPEPMVFCSADEPIPTTQLQPLLTSPVGLSTRGKETENISPALDLSHEQTNATPGNRNVPQGISPISEKGARHISPSAPLSPARLLSNNKGINTDTENYSLDPPTASTQLRINSCPPLPSLLKCNREPLFVPLFSHQRVGVEWLKQGELENKKGMVLGDATGLGKTIQSLAYIAEMQSGPTLIIVSSNLIKQWQYEIKDKLQKKNPHLRYYTYQYSKERNDFPTLRQYDIVLTTYYMLRDELKESRRGTQCLIGDSFIWER